MELLRTVLIYGSVGSVILSSIVLAMVRYNPRLMLQDYPRDVQQKVPPKTRAEKRLTAYWGSAFLFLLVAVPTAAAISVKVSHPDAGFGDVFLTPFGVAVIFNLVDLLILDWLIFCTITPRFAVIPGTEGMAGYKDYGMHFRGFLIGIAISVALGAVITLIVVNVSQRVAGTLACCPIQGGGSGYDIHIWLS